MTTNITDIARYAADVAPVFTESEITVEISTVRIGDKRGGRVVRDIKLGRLNTELLDEDGKRIDYQRNETPILITRTERTLPSIEAGQRQRNNRIMAEKLAFRTDRLKAAQAGLNEQLDSRGCADYGRYGELLAAQAEHKVLMDFESFSTLTNDDGSDRFTDLVEAYAKFSEYMTRQLIQDTRHRALSRSTSVMSNLLDDCDRQAVAEFLEFGRWYL